ITAEDLSRVLTPTHRIKPTSTRCHSAWQPNPAEAPLIDAEILFRQAGPAHLDVSWLNQLDDVIFGHGISLLRWRSGGVKHPHDMPPFRFPPSPTLGDSSWKQA